MASKQVGVTPEAELAISAYATKYNIPLTEALDRMIGIAVTRLNAVSKYAAKKKGEKPAKAKKAKKAAKPAKAKGPIARKAKAAKEASA